MFGLTLTFLISQVFAGFALLFSVISFQFKKRDYIILFFIFSAICIALQYIFLERYVWAALVGVWIIRYFVSYRYPRDYLIPVFIVLFWILTIIFWKDGYDILPFLSASLNTIWAFQKNDKKLRIFMLFWSPILVIYYLLIGSPIWILLEGMFLWSNLVWYYRHYLKK